MFPQFYYFLPLDYTDIDFSLIKVSILQLCIIFLLKLCSVVKAKKEKSPP